ncbi:MAG TPA: DUF6691 family protein [Burkholderiaceae bacterium]|nr:DUF6691 family protein [Burkholderiaceae bacterium]
MRGIVFALAAGVLFGIGLIAGGMTDPAKVQGFLDLFGRWDPSLAFVIGGAIAVAVGAFALARRRKERGAASWSGEPIELPTSTVIDARLIGGGVLFGIGWGLAGFCPGPAIVAAASGYGPALWFLPAMLAGMLLHDAVVSRLGAPR